MVRHLHLELKKPEGLIKVLRFRLGLIIHLGDDQFILLFAAFSNSCSFSSPLSAKASASL